MHQGAGKLYRIVVGSELSGRYAEAFEGMDMETKGGLTIITGRVVDQVQLHGILDRVSDLGLELLSVECLHKGDRNDAASLAPITEEGP